MRVRDRPPKSRSESEGSDFQPALEGHFLVRKWGRVGTRQPTAVTTGRRNHGSVDGWDQRGRFGGWDQRSRRPVPSLGALGEVEPCVRHQIVALTQVAILSARTKYFLQFSTISQEYSTAGNIFHYFYPNYLVLGQSSESLTMAWRSRDRGSTRDCLWRIIRENQGRRPSQARPPSATECCVV